VEILCMENQAQKPSRLMQGSHGHSLVQAFSPASGEAEDSPL